MGLKARGVMIDMEEGVIGQIKSSPIAPLFDEHQSIVSNSGSGNNWAMGYSVYGSEYKDQILESIRVEAEYCDSLQSFFCISSLGGGTGSGLGSRVGEFLQDEYPEVYRFNTVLCPSADDDVVTSPYNALMSLSKLISTSDCVLPVENQALLDICERVSSASSSASIGSSALKSKTPTATTITDSGSVPYGGLCVGKRKSRPFDEMNNIVARLLMNMTSSMRFEGSLNVDINDIVTNLVPFPRQKFLLPSMTPLYTVADLNIAPRRLDQMFTDAFSRESQLIRADPKTGTYLACALIARGDVEVSDLRRNVERRKANLHHYTKYIELAEFQAALESVESVIEEYKRQMARQRRSAAPSRPAPQQTRSASTTSHPPAPAPAPQSQVPMMQPQQVQQPSLFANMASTAAGVAVGSAVGHTIGAGISGLFGGGSRSEPAPAPQQQQQQQPQQFQQNVNPCEPDQKAFYACLDKNQNDISACQFYLDMFKQYVSLRFVNFRQPLKFF
ncbi:Tubulin epsilon chain [Chytridiales sp. JEL 0842]|nr:Tubulin epsilon chain [Chytridiales sp. JEL 0842]